VRAAAGMKLAFFKKYRVKLIMLFALTYPFLAVFVRSYCWWRLDPTYAKILDKNSYDLGPFPECMIYFTPSLTLFCLLPIKPRFLLGCSVVIIAMIYLVAMVWPVYQTSFSAYCSLKSIDPCEY
jgi:hypothetical protein